MRRGIATGAAAQLSDLGPLVPCSTAVDKKLTGLHSILVAARHSHSIGRHRSHASFIFSKQDGAEDDVGKRDAAMMKSEEKTQAASEKRTEHNAEKEASKGEVQEKSREDGDLVYTDATNHEIYLSSKGASECKQDCDRSPRLMSEEDLTQAENPGSVKRQAKAQVVDSTRADATSEDKREPCHQFCDEQLGFYCFPGNATVILKDKGAVAMQDLSVGDYMLVLEEAHACEGQLDELDRYAIGFAPVLLFLHADPNVTSEMVVVEHELGCLRLSPNHLLLAKRCGEKSFQFCEAEKLHVGDQVSAPGSLADMVASEVRSIARCRSQGVFAPLVRSGAIIVDATAASCYALPADVRRFSIGGTSMELLCGIFARLSNRGDLGEFDWQKVAHVAFAPVRVFHSLLGMEVSHSMCKQWWSSSFCTYLQGCVQAKGVHPYAWMVYMLFMATSP